MLELPVLETVPTRQLDIEADVPQLLPLFELCPDIRIYTRNNAYFKALARLLAAWNDAMPLAIV